MIFYCLLISRGVGWIIATLDPEITRVLELLWKLLGTKINDGRGQLRHLIYLLWSVQFNSVVILSFSEGCSVVENHRSGNSVGVNYGPLASIGVGVHKISILLLLIS